MVANRVVSPAFIGRADDMSALLSAYRSAADTAPGVALIAGEAGIGKSRLTAEFVAALGTGARVAAGGCTRLDGDGLGYAPIVAVLRTLIRELGAERVTELLPGPGRELARWFPELGAATSGDKLRLYEEILTVVEAAAAKPLVIVLEDVHWADPATAELLGFLARNLTRPGVLVVATYRDDEPPSGPLLSELRRGAHTTRLRLAPLTRHEVARQLAEILGDRPDPATARRYHERSDGNPLFVEALAQSGGNTPDAQLLLHAPRSLPEPQRRVLRAVSASSGHVRHDLLAAVTELPDDELDDLARHLVESGLLTATSDGYRFRHALIQRAVYDDLLPGRRNRLHARYAEALRDTDSPAELAAHTHAAGDHAAALDAACLAARAARASYAYWEEARMLDRILQLWADVPDAATRLGLDRVAVWTSAAECCMLSGDYARGIDYATAGLNAVDAHREPHRAATLLEHRGRLRDRVDATGIPDLERALELLSRSELGGQPAASYDPGGESEAGRTEPSRLVRGRLLGLMAMATLRGNVDAAHTLAEQALLIGRETGDHTVTVRGLLGVGAVTSDLDMLAKALSITEEIRDHDLEITALMYLAIHHTRQGDHRRSAMAAREGMDRARRLGLTRSRGTMLASHLAKALILSGRWEDAASVVDEALAEDPPPMPTQILRAIAGQLAALRGERATAAELAASLPDGDERLGTHFLARYQFLILAALAEDDAEHADDLLGHLLSSDVIGKTASVELRPVLVAGALVQRVRDDTAAHARRSRLAELNAALPVRGRLDNAWYGMVQALTTSDDHESWGRVAAEWRDLGQPYELAQSLIFAARAAGDRTPPKEATDILTGLSAASPRFQTDRTDDDSGLSDRELEVLALVADGLSNRRIAGKLYISPSTAGVHVSHILAKLGAVTRAEAASIAHRRGLV